MKRVILFAHIVAMVLIINSNAHAFCFEEAGRAYGISPQLLSGMAETESGMNPKAINHNVNGSSDYGLMQINSLWLKPLKLTPGELLNDPCLNTRIGARVLRGCIDRYGYGWMAVGCYNASSQDKRATYAWKIFSSLKKAEKAKQGRGNKQVAEAQTVGETQSSTVATSTLLFKSVDLE